VDEFALILFFFAGVLVFLGGIRLLIEAFGVSPLWFVTCIVVPPAALIFVWFHWEDVKGSFYLIVAGTVLAATAGAFIPPHPKTILPAIPDRTDKIGVLSSPASPLSPVAPLFT
jgi:hypothetical protein